MKARVKATGEIVDLAPYTRVCEDFAKGRSWLVEELADADDIPDYWTRLEHQAAIAAMQGMLAGTYYQGLTYDRVVEDAQYIAHALVEKYKKEERK